MREIREFLKSNRKIIEIRYKGARLNAACDWYKLRSPFLMAFRGLLNEIFKKIPPCGLKNSLYRSMGVKIGKDVVISPDAHLDPLFPELIEIDDGVILGWSSKIFAHEMTNHKIRLGRIKIKRNACIGGCSVIRSGVTIGKNSVVSMSSFVNKDVKDNLLVGGIPANKLNKDNI